MSCVSVGFSGLRDLTPHHLTCVSHANVILLEPSTAASHVLRSSRKHLVNHCNFSFALLGGFRAHNPCFFCCFFFCGLVSHLQEGGQCQCKVAVTGHQCENCLPGWYGLKASNSDGCIRCNCSKVGAINTSAGAQSCDQKTGQCQCKAHVTGEWRFFSLLNMSYQ